MIKRRKSSRQASQFVAEKNMENEDYNSRFKSAFKEGTKLLRQ